MKRRSVLILVTLVVLAGLAAWFFWRSRSATGVDAEAGLESDAAVIELVEVEETWMADLYFPSVSGLLSAEAHEVADSDVVTARISAVVTKLLGGPRGTTLRPPLPAGVAVRKVYLETAGVVYLDLETVDGAPPPAAGSSREMLMIYSLVNTVLLNFEEVEQLVLLWNGAQLNTFAGHMDTRRPLSANLDLIARTP